MGSGGERVRERGALSYTSRSAVLADTRGSLREKHGFRLLPYGTHRLPAGQCLPPQARSIWVQEGRGSGRGETQWASPLGFPFPGAFAFLLPSLLQQFLPCGRVGTIPALQPPKGIFFPKAGRSIMSTILYISYLSGILALAAAFALRRVRPRPILVPVKAGGQKRNGRMRP